MHLSPSSRRLALALAACLAGMPTAAADDERPSLDLSMLGTLGELSDVEISADEASVSRTGVSHFSGNVVISSGGTRISADGATYDPAEKRFSVAGNVRFEDNDVELSAGEARFATETDEGEFRDARYQLKGRNGRGDAESIRSDGSTFLILDDVRYSACPVGENDWRLIANRIKLDRENDIGVGRNVRVEFKGTPILYAPYLSFPASGKRKSGFLLPDYGNTDRSGNEFAFPYYWNIAPNYDATITPRWFTDRGLQFNALGRYLLPETNGSLEASFLPGDDLASEDRYLIHLQHDGWFDNGLRLHADISDVSDSDYFADFSSSLAGTSTTHLERLLELEYRAEPWTFAARAQVFQTIDDTITRENRPYKRLPQLSFGGRWNGLLGLHYGFDAELTHFERDAGARGQRFDIEPVVSLPLETTGISVVPEVRLSHRRYELDDLESETLSNPSSTVPIFSLDGRMIFERMAGREARLLHTFEPRLRYTHIPYEDQDDIPVFDTGLPDFNLIQLFRDNRYEGIDRIGDTDTLSLGVTTRVFDTRDGRELVSATLGYARFLSARNVELPGRPVTEQDSSNIITEIGFDFSDQWNADVEYQWSPDRSETAKAAMRVQYRPADNKVINVAYRFQDNELEQSDISFAWPVGSHWNLVGRWTYSLEESTTLERFAGLEYERCCWAARLVTRRYVNNRDGSTDNALFAQFELKGLTSIGTRVDAFLERGILGYGKDYD